MSVRLQNFVARYRADIETSLFESLPLSKQRCALNFNEALQYAVFPGGKRWRPILSLLGGLLVGAQVKNILPVACAIEYLHTSSMILDDLPAMDDADLRRGKSALHLAYDESTAMLVSLALMNHSYALLAEACRRSGKGEKAARLVAEATDCLGSDGMIGGQVVDLELRGRRWGLESLVSRNLKTTALMRLTMTAAAITTGASENEIEALAHYGESLGAAYQICDDLLDEIGEARVIGKTVKQDSRHLRLNFVDEYGVCGAQKIAEEFIKAGTERLKRQFGNNYEVTLLLEAAEIIVKSKNLLANRSIPDLVTAN